MQASIANKSLNLKDDKNAKNIVAAVVAACLYYTCIYCFCQNTYSDFSRKRRQKNKKKTILYSKHSLED